MIINFPTGLYSTVLPVLPQDSRSVTYTISNETPPRTNLLYPKAPDALIAKPKDSRKREAILRRPTMGDLVFSVSKSSRTETGNSERLYEIGQVLEFFADPIKTIEPMLVSDKTEIIHNVSRINYAGLDISEQDTSLIESNTLAIYDQLNNSLNEVREQRKKYEQIISNNQKIINDANRTISALSIVNNIEYNREISDVILKMEVKIVEANEKIQEASTFADDLSRQATVIQDQIRAVALVIK